MLVPRTFPDLLGQLTRWYEVGRDPWPWGKGSKMESQTC